jgi:hypothetical protein
MTEREAIADLIDRLSKAHREISRLALSTDSRIEFGRLTGKAEGLALAFSYSRDALALLGGGE